MKKATLRKNRRMKKRKTRKKRKMKNRKTSKKNEGGNYSGSGGGLQLHNKYP